jgi:DNA polymerase type B, organellar and viral
MFSMTNLIGTFGGHTPARDLFRYAGQPMSNADRCKKHHDSLTPEQKYERNKIKRRNYNISRPFIGWDGEGINCNGPGKPQSYVLFGASTGNFIVRRDSHTLAFGDCAELILKVGRENPSAWHVGFAFDYDTNQIIRTLPYRILEILNAKGQVNYGPYWINWRKGKSLTISKRIGESRESVTIYDVFSFFASSFVKALQAILGSDNEFSAAVDFVARGKDRRKHFTLKELNREIIPYWREELRLLSILVSRFRDLLYSADLPITKWYGPGAIASLVLNRYDIRSHMSLPPDEVIEASQYAYAGGRFERFRVGQYKGPVWAIDLNSAYPNALSQLPSLANGHWVYEPIGKSFSEIPCNEIRSFAIYHVKLSHPQWRLPFYPNTPPSPLFFRTDKGEMRYPWHVKGWYWGPEVENLCHGKIAPHAYCYGVWYFSSTTEERPFGFIREMYSRRQEWKRAGKPEQLALKLAMNSIYGKLAQRVGWEHTGSAPRFHQLEWAGWVTSYVRAELFRTLWMLGKEIVSVETDGIYTTRDPGRIGIQPSSDLGDWSVTEYSGIIYLQSGTYFAESKDGWISKYRGLDPTSLSRETAIEYLSSFDYTGIWPPLSGTTTRYIGLAAAMMQAAGNTAKFRGRHGVWEQDKDKDINPAGGKRSHHADSCVECSKGISPSDYPHYMGITIDLLPDGINHSTKHYLPWRDGVKSEPTWRKAKEIESAKLFE